MSGQASAVLHRRRLTVFVHINEEEAFVHAIGLRLLENTFNGIHPVAFKWQHWRAPDIRQSNRRSEHMRGWKSVQARHKQWHQSSD